MAAEDGKGPIVIAVDGSDNAEYAVQWYLDNYHRDGNRIVLVTVPEYIPPNAMMSPGVVQELLQKADKEVVELRNKYLTGLTSKGLNVSFERLEGKAGEAIVDHVKKCKASCVVTGTRGLGKFRRTIMGSVSDYIVHHSPCPVLICRHKEHHKDHH